MDFQMQRMTSAFIDHFGFNDEEFREKVMLAVLSNGALEEKKEMKRDIVLTSFACSHDT